MKLERPMTPASDTFMASSPKTPEKCLSDEEQAPWTPNSNFKVLLKALSPEMKKKDRLFDETSTDPISTPCKLFAETSSNKPETHVGRKEKSLGVLCQRFLKKYPPYLPANILFMEVCIKDAASYLGVSRRRVYDIINVMEAIGLTSRVGKNKYHWFAKNNISSIILHLHELALEEGLDVKIKKFQAMEAFNNTCSQSAKPPLSQSQEEDEEEDSESLAICEAGESKKSLTALSQKFIMMFLVSQDHSLHLELGARVLLDDLKLGKNDMPKFKTMIRRLYDIANIMTSLELISKKVLVGGKGRKPQYIYIGPQPFANKGVASKGRGLQRHLTFDHICYAASEARNLLNDPGSGEQASLPLADESSASLHNNNSNSSTSTIESYEQSKPSMNINSNALTHNFFAAKGLLGLSKSFDKDKNSFLNNSSSRIKIIPMNINNKVNNKNNNTFSTKRKWSSFVINNNILTPKTTPTTSSPICTPAPPPLCILTPPSSASPLRKITISTTLPSTINNNPPTSNLHKIRFVTRNTPLSTDDKATVKRFYSDSSVASSIQVHSKTTEIVPKKVVRLIIKK